MKKILTGIVVLMLISGTGSFAADKNKKAKQACTTACKDKKDCKDMKDCSKTCKSKCGK